MLVNIPALQRRFFKFVTSEGHWKGEDGSHFFVLFCMFVSSLASYGLKFMDWLNAEAGISHLKHGWFDHLFMGFSIFVFLLGLVVYLEVQYDLFTKLNVDDWRDPTDFSDD